MARTVLPPYLERALVGGGVLRAVAVLDQNGRGTPLPARPCLLWGLEVPCLVLQGARPQNMLSAILLGRAAVSLEARCLAQAPAQQGAQLGASVGSAFVYLCLLRLQLCGT